MKKFFLAKIPLALLGSCKREDENVKHGIYKTKEIGIYKGKGCTWGQPDKHGRPAHPAIFTPTFILGSYDGKVRFYEPVNTLQFLKNTGIFERAVPQPAKYQQSGYYPTTLRVINHNKELKIF